MDAVATAGDAGPIDFEVAWNGMWPQIAAALTPQRLHVLAMVGVAVVLVSLGGIVYRRSQGRNGREDSFVWTLLIGAVFAAPGFLVPLVLRGLDWVCNFVIGLFGG